jgi:LysR family glycine cleavage system transcriptional activator
MQRMCEKIARMFNLLPPLNAVRAFVAAARHQSFTLAASELHVTHGAVSRQVKALEDYLGVLLFERQVRQVSLTAEGLRFFAQAEAALQQISAAAQSVTSRPASRTIRINVRPSFAVRWLIPRLPEFVAQYPGIEPHVDTSTLPPEKAVGNFDIAIRRGLKGWPSAWQVCPFLEDVLCAVASPALLGTQSITEPGALVSFPLLWAKTRNGDWDAWRRLAGIDAANPASRMQFEHVHFALQAAVDGLGFAVAPLSLASHDLVRGRLRCPFPDLWMQLPRYYYAVAPDSAPEVQFFVEWIENELLKQRANPALFAI